MSGRYEAVMVAGVVEVHATGHNSVYATLCGLDGTDHEQKIVPLQIGARIDCKECQMIIKHAKTYRPKDFASAP